jgi:hypothetical protein
MYTSANFITLFWSSQPWSVKGSDARYLLVGKCWVVGGVGVGAIPWEVLGSVPVGGKVGFVPDWIGASRFGTFDNFGGLIRLGELDSSGWDSSGCVQFLIMM